MGRKVKRETTNQFLIIRCDELNDQYECDANRVPICITEDIKNYRKYGYEIYEIYNDGYLKLIQEYDL